MDGSDFIDLTQKTINIIIQITWPFLVMTLVIGVGVGILQAASQIQEMTLAFLPKLVGVVILIFFLGPSLGYKFQNFVEQLFDQIIRVGGR